MKVLSSWLKFNFSGVLGMGVEVVGGLCSLASHTYNCRFTLLLLHRVIHGLFELPLDVGLSIWKYVLRVKSHFVSCSITLSLFSCWVPLLVPFKASSG